jgi:hypothetical protein
MHEKTSHFLYVFLTREMLVQLVNFEKCHSSLLRSWLSPTGTVSSVVCRSELIISCVVCRAKLVISKLLLNPNKRSRFHLNPKGRVSLFMH